MNKDQLLEKWNNRIQESDSNGQILFKAQAKQNYFTIKNNSVLKALELLNAEYKKYSELGISSFIKEAIDDLEDLK